MAKLKAEVEHANHQENGSSLRDKLFANVDRLNAVASALAPLRTGPRRCPVPERSPKRRSASPASATSLTFAGESFEDWF